MSSKRQRDARQAFDREFQEQEKQKRFEAEAPIRKATHEQQELLRQIADQERAIVRQTIFTEPSEYLNEHCTQYNDGRFISNEQTEQAAVNAVSSWKMFMDEQRGTEITPSGFTKLSRVVSLNRSIDTTNSENIVKIWDWLDSNGCLNSSDFKVTRVIQPVVEQARKAERAEEDINRDLDNLAKQTDTPTVRARRAALLKEMRILEYTDLNVTKPLWNEFVKFIRETYPDFDFNLQLRRQATDWLADRELPMNALTLNKLRREFLGLKTHDEILCDQLTNDPRQAGDWSFKRDVRQAQLKIQAVTQ